MIFVRSNIPREIFKIKDSEKTKLINLVVEICKRNNIGSIKPHQRMQYSKEGLEIVKKVSEFVLWFYENECPNFRTRMETKKLVEDLVKSISGNKSILFFALFCPSYKKGGGGVGFNRSIGYTTKTGILNLSAICKKAKSLEIKCGAQALYSDLALENYSKLSEEDFEDMEASFNIFRKYGGGMDDSITFLKLSDIRDSSEVIGRNGISNGKMLLNKRDFNKIVKRSLRFYIDILGWTKDSVIKRTKNLARSCFAISETIKKQNNLAIMIMTENIYERGIFYHANQKGSIIPIFYPKKLNSKIVRLC